MLEAQFTEHLAVADGDEEQGDGDEDAVLHEELVGLGCLRGAHHSGVEGFEVRGVGRKDDCCHKAGDSEVRHRVPHPGLPATGRKQLGERDCGAGDQRGRGEVPGVYGPYQAYRETDERRQDPRAGSQARVDGDRVCHRERDHQTEERHAHQVRVKVGEE